jgi:hypothetical protein
MIAHIIISVRFIANFLSLLSHMMIADLK